MPYEEDLHLHVSSAGGATATLVAVGEVLWDVFPGSLRLGGAPLNFAAHAKRLGLSPILISAVGMDELGKKAVRELGRLGVDLHMVRRSALWKTGTASVAVDANGQPSFQIPRPAAYDDLRLSPAQLQSLAALEPAWFYFGTVFPSTAQGRTTLQQLLEALPRAARFYDVNLRPGSDSPALVAELLAAANVVKLNEDEAQTVARSLGLPSEMEPFCRDGCERFGWRAVCITLGERGCAMFDGREFARAEGVRIQVADTVGAGDAFAAAFVYGLMSGWPVSQMAHLANRVGALVASRAGAIPEWSMAEAVGMGPQMNADNV